MNFYIIISFYRRILFQKNYLQIDHKLYHKKIFYKNRKKIPTTKNEETA